MIWLVPVLFWRYSRVVAKTSRDALFIRWITTSLDVRKSGCEDISRRSKKDKSALPLARLIIPRRDSGVAPVSTVVKTIYNAAYLSMLRLPRITLRSLRSRIIATVRASLRLLNWLRQDKL
jgi:hypothetical protein